MFPKRKTSGGAALRARLAQPGVVVAPGAFSPLIARLVEQVGFEAVYMTGNGTVANLLDLPDIGLATMTEMVLQARNMAGRVTIPVIADADTGNGNAISVIRTVREYERAGVAAIHLEDQDWPKRCAILERAKVVPVDEMVGKIRAAVDAREDADLIIIARSDALGAEGLQPALARGEAYLSAGADVLFIEGAKSIDEVRMIGNHFRGASLLYNIGAGGETPKLTVREVEEFGYKIAILPVFTLLAATRSVRELLIDLRVTGDINRSLDRCDSFDDLLAAVDFNAVDELEQRYGIGPRA